MNTSFFEDGVELLLHSETTNVSKHNFGYKEIFYVANLLFCNFYKQYVPLTAVNTFQYAD